MSLCSDVQSNATMEDNFYTPANGIFYASGQYSELNPAKHEIRLLELVSTQEGEPLQARLTHNCFITPNSPRPEYCAVSYFAGDYKKTRPIQVNSIEFSVFRNLQRALYQVHQGILRGELNEYSKLL